jgi:membrane-associated protein
VIRTQRFYEKYGGKTIVLARFIPIIRTFAPFVAGIGTMAYPRFALFNVTGGAAWILSFLLGGYFFGNVPVVKQNFQYVIVAIILISIMPPVLEYLRVRRESGAAAAEKGAR